MRVIVTGGAGFIGSHLVEFLLKKKYKIIVIDNLSTGRKENIKHFSKKITFINADLSKKGKWINYFNNIDCMFHLAALADIVPSIQFPEKYFQSNVVATLNILECCKKFNVNKLIYAASSSCYGIPKAYPTSENNSLDPKYFYALSKLQGEQLVLHWSKIYKISAISLRLFNVYGTKSRTSGTYGAMFGVFLAQRNANKPLTIIGNGKQKRDFIYVSDVVNALYLASKSKLKSEIFNVGSGNPVSVDKVANLISSKRIYIPKRPGEPDTTHANIYKIKSKLKWRPKIKIEEGVVKILNELEYWKKAPVWTPQTIKNATKIWFKLLK